MIRDHLRWTCKANEIINKYVAIKRIVWKVIWNSKRCWNFHKSVSKHPRIPEVYQTFFKRKIWKLHQIVECQSLQRITNSDHHIFRRKKTHASLLQNISPPSHSFVIFFTFASHAANSFSFTNTPNWNLSNFK